MPNTTLSLTCLHISRNASTSPARQATRRQSTPIRTQAAVAAGSTLLCPRRCAGPSTVCAARVLGLGLRIGPRVGAASQVALGLLPVLETSGRYVSVRLSCSGLYGLSSRGGGSHVAQVANDMPVRMQRTRWRRRFICLASLSRRLRTPTESMQERSDCMDASY